MALQADEGFILVLEVPVLTVAERQLVAEAAIRAARTLVPARAGFADLKTFQANLLVDVVEAYLASALRGSPDPERPVGFTARAVPSRP